MADGSEPDGSGSEVSPVTLNDLLASARANLGGAMESSARLSLSEAVQAKDAGDFEAAIWWAVRSLRYSVGVFHPAYVRASASVVPFVARAGGVS